MLDFLSPSSQKLGLQGLAKFPVISSDGHGEVVTSVWAHHKKLLSTVTSVCSDINGSVTVPSRS